MSQNSRDKHTDITNSPSPSLLFPVSQALMGPGRLDRIVYVPLPDDRIVYVPLPDGPTQQEIFTLQLRSMPVDQDMCLDDLVTRTEKYSGAEVRQTVLIMVANKQHVLYNSNFMVEYIEDAGCNTHCGPNPNVRC